MGLTLFFIFIVGIASSVAGPDCRNISGHWQNELGSHMVIDLDERNLISGQYWTAVESSKGASAIVSNVSGLVSHRKAGTLLAFSVVFNHGASVASWVGQCSVYDGKNEVLYTTYVLKSYTVDPKAKWKSIIVNQNTFRRFEVEKEDNSAMPDGPTFLAHSSQPITSSLHSGDFNIDGKWKSSSGGEIEILRNAGSISKAAFTSGKLKLNVKEDARIYVTGDQSEVEYNISGSQKQQKFSGLAFAGVIDERIRSWTGHAFGSSSHRSMETVWLEHEYSTDSPTTGVRIGMEDFINTSPNDGYTLKASSETFFEKIRKFFASMF